MGAGQSYSIDLHHNQQRPFEERLRQLGHSHAHARRGARTNVRRRSSHLLRRHNERLVVMRRRFNGLLMSPDRARSAKQDWHKGANNVGTRLLS